MGPINPSVFLEKVREWLSEWGLVRWTAVILAAFVLTLTGISLFHEPSCEVIYFPMRMPLKANKNGEQLVLYSVEIGNTGSETQGDVRFRFSREAMDHLFLNPSAKNYGVTPRPIKISKDRTSMAIDLGRHESEKRVTLTFILLYPKEQEPHAWEAMFLGAEPAKGKARQGNPGMTMVGRAWFSLFGRGPS